MRVVLVSPVLEETSQIVGVAGKNTREMSEADDAAVMYLRLRVGRQKSGISDDVIIQEHAELPRRVLDPTIEGCCLTLIVLLINVQKVRGGHSAEHLCGAIGRAINHDHHLKICRRKRLPR